MTTASKSARGGGGSLDAESKRGNVAILWLIKSCVSGEFVEAAKDQRLGLLESDDPIYARSPNNDAELDECE